MNTLANLEIPSNFKVLERGWLSANSVLILGDEQAAVIDTGYISHAEQTVGLVDAALGGQALGYIVNTHLHSDHCGGNANLQRRWPMAQTLIPPGHSEAVRRWDTAALSYDPTGQRCERFEFTQTLVPGSTLSLPGADLEVHAAPGHDPHSVVFFHQKSQCLLSADALWENGFGVVFPALEGIDAFADVGASLDLIESLNPRCVIPGHGAPFTDVAGALARARQRLKYFAANPAKHALHGIKVLIKYHLLEVQREPVVAFEAWAAQTPYFAMVHAQYGTHRPLNQWIHDAVLSLVDSQAAALTDDELSNISN